MVRTRVCPRHVKNLPASAEVGRRSLVSLGGAQSSIVRACVCVYVPLQLLEPICIGVCVHATRGTITLHGINIHPCVH